MEQSKSDLREWLTSSNLSGLGTITATMVISLEEDMLEAVDVVEF